MCRCIFNVFLRIWLWWDWNNGSKYLIRNILQGRSKRIYTGQRWNVSNRWVLCYIPHWSILFVIGTCVNKLSLWINYRRKKNSVCSTKTLLITYHSLYSVVGKFNIYKCFYLFYVEHTLFFFLLWFIPRACRQWITSLHASHSKSNACFSVTPKHYV